MGSGIAYTAASHGYNVVCVDTDATLVKKAFVGLRELADRRINSGKMSHIQCDETFARLQVGDKLAALKDADFVIEAVAEDMPLKRKIFGELDRFCSARMILATNTSSLSVSAMAETLTHPERFVGMHFFNPAYIMPLVEIIAGGKTNNQTIVETVALSRAMEKTPVKAKDRPGFIANRVARPFYLESLALLERGVADIRTIDSALKTAGFPMGPFELLDLIGLDINLAVTKSVFAGFGNAPRFAPNPIQERLVAEGRLGRKTGRGFYDHSGAQPAPAYETPIPGLPAGTLDKPAFKAFAAGLGRPADAATWVYSRIISAIINEGVNAVGEKTSLARDVDLAMTLGFNYPEGPMTTADGVGLDIVHDLLKSFEPDSPSGRHAPAALLIEHIKAGELGEKTAAGLLRHSL